MKKEYVEPQIEICYYSGEDIITASYEIVPGENELPIVPIKKPGNITGIKML